MQTRVTKPPTSAANLLAAGVEAYGQARLEDALELLEWLALKPRTQGWGAVVAYDRNKCNALLLQDYIHKFTADRYEEPISKPVPLGDDYWVHLHDWVTDVPRLSFEDSSQGPGGEVNLRMAIVGGSVANAARYESAQRISASSHG